MQDFTPYSAFAGGLLIGLSATIMLLFNGRVTGISGMLSGLLTSASGGWLRRLVFLISMMLGAWLFVVVFPGSYVPRSNFPLPLLIAGGFLVGFGTRLGSGCTSGHAICGIARRSTRSILATCIFMFTGGLTVFVIRHLTGIAI